MQAGNANQFPYSSGADLASQNALMQGLGMNSQTLATNPQGAMGGFMQNQQPIGYPMFDQGMQNNFQSPQGNLGMNQFNPMLMQQNMAHQFQGFGMPQNAMAFQMQQQMMAGVNPQMMSAMGDQMNPYGGMNPQAFLAHTLQGAQLQNPYGSADAMSMTLQGMMGSNRGNNMQNSNNFNNFGSGNNQKFNNNQNNEGALRLNTVYVSDLPPDVDHDMLKDNFSKVGSIKLNSKSGMPMIWIFKDRGVPKGDALVTYDSNSSATNAIAFFKDNDFNGRKIDVRIATNNERPILAPPTNNDTDNSWAKNDGNSRRQRGSGGQDYKSNSRSSGSGGNDKNRGPDWICSKCSNNNFSWREQCNRCQEPKSDDVNDKREHSASRGFNSGGSGGGSRSSNNRMVHRNTSSRSQEGGPMRAPRKSSSRPGPY